MDANETETILATPRKGRGFWYIISGLMFLGTVPLSWLIRDAIVGNNDGKYWVCGFRKITSIPCPLCGLTRAFAHVTHGQFDLAFQRNPAWPVAMAIILILGFSLLVDGIKGTDSFGKIGNILKPYWWHLIATVLAFGVLRVIFAWH